MTQQPFLQFLSVLAAAFMLCTSFFVEIGAKKQFEMGMEFSLELNETEEGNHGQEDVQEELKHISAFHFVINPLWSGIASYAMRDSAFPIVPHLEKPTPPPNTI